MDIKTLLNVKEAFEVPTALLNTLLSEKKDIFLNEIVKGDNLENDFLRDVFQEEHSDRKNMMQDYTPDSVARILTATNKLDGVILDMCAGTGSLTIQQWRNNKDTKFVCIEYSARAIPFLLSNLCVRNIEATVIHGDALNGKNECIYSLTPSDQYSNISILEESPKVEMNHCITNPPYSLSWNPAEYRFIDGYDLAPKSKADYAFILTALNQVKGSVNAILPHGVLFRGANEGKIRQKLIENNIIDTVIGLPEKLFLNTDIPTVILILNQNKTSNGVYFVDASKLGTHVKNKNILNDEDIEKIIKTVQERKEVEKFAHLASLEEIRSNDYSLNIPRYVDSFEPKAIPNIVEVSKEILTINERMKEINIQLSHALDDMVANSSFKSVELNVLKDMLMRLNK